MCGFVIYSLEFFAYCYCHVWIPFAFKASHHCHGQTYHVCICDTLEAFALVIICGFIAASFAIYLDLSPLLHTRICGFYQYLGHIRMCGF